MKRVASTEEENGRGEDGKEAKKMKPGQRRKGKCFPQSSFNLTEYGMKLWNEK